VGDQSGALADFSQAIANDSRFRAAWECRARIRAKSRDLVGALADYEHALELDPSNSQLKDRRNELVLQLQINLNTSAIPER
jgi:Tfp pilus assembly protein PilF